MAQNWRARVLAELFEDGVGVRGVMDYAEGVDQVVRLDGDEGGKLFGIAGAEADAVLQAEDFGALASEGHRFIGEVDGGDLGAVAGEVDRVGADAAANFQDFLAAPVLEVGEGGDVRFDQIFSGFDFVEIFFGADRLRGMADVAGTIVPVVPNAVDLDVGKCHAQTV